MESHGVVLKILTFLALTPAVFSQEPSIKRLDPALDALLDQNTLISKLAEGFKWSEGPVWNPTTTELLFCDNSNNVIHAWKESTGLRVFMKPSGYTGVAE